MKEKKIPASQRRGRIANLSIAGGEEKSKSFEGASVGVLLERKRDKTVKSTIENVRRILTCDERLRGKIRMNTFSHRVVVVGDLPWKRESETWTDADDSALRHFMEVEYGFSPGVQKIFDAFQVATSEASFHPVLEYLDGLKWDGTARIETLLIDFLGAADTEYTRIVTRKALCAAVARIFQPGIKFDHVVILSGPQGIGKSTFIKNLCGSDWYSDSLSGIGGKEAYELLQGKWILELPELHAVKRTEIETFKFFVTKDVDCFRKAYGRRTANYPRQCVFWGSTNSTEFLQDQTGNRRFWPIAVGVGKKKKDLWREEELLRDQVWAEAVKMWHDGEVIWADAKFAAIAEQVQEAHREISPQAGLIYEFLNTPIPERWGDRDIGEKLTYLDNSLLYTEKTRQRKKICALEIWVEYFRGDPRSLSWKKSKEIGDILRNLPNWQETKRIHFGDGYGRQRAFLRVAEK